MSKRMEVEKNREYYEHLAPTDLCQCAYCRNFVKEIKKTYPLVARYLEKMGIDIEKPFETLPTEPDEEQNIEYLAAEYIAFGDARNFEKTVVSDVNIEVTEFHPSTSIQENHFVIEIFPIKLKWVM